MSDTTTLTPEERAELIAHVNSGYMTISGEGLKRALAALEQAEARAERAESAQLALCDIALELGCACDNEAMLLAVHGLKARAEKAEVEVSRLNKMVDWLAQHGTCPNKGLSYDNFKCDGTIPCRECMKEAARKAVAGDGEGEENADCPA